MKKFLSILLIVFFLTISCDSEEISEVPVAELKEQFIGPQLLTGPEMGSATPEDIPQIISELERLTNTKVQSSKSISFKRAIIDMNQIKWIKDEATQDKNYTFPMVVLGQGDNEFFNLIVREQKNGKLKKPKIRRYVVASHAIDAYRASEFDFSKFQGNYYLYDFERFFDAIDFKEGKLTMRLPDCHDGSTIGSGVSAPIENNDLIQVDSHFNWQDPSETYPVGAISFSSSWYSETVFTAGSYINSTSEGYQYEEEVATNSYGHVSGDNTLNGPILTSFNLNTYAVPPTSFNVTANYAPDGTSWSMGPDICTVKVIITVSDGNGGSFTSTYYAGCQAVAPANKSSSSVTNKPDCPEDDSGSVITINLKQLFVVQQKLSLDTNSQGYQHLVTHPDDLSALAAFLKQYDVQPYPSYSPEKEFALNAVTEWPSGATVNFDDQIIINLTGKALVIYNNLLNSGRFGNLIRKFDGQIPVSHLKFSEKDLPNTVRAATVPPENYVIEIILNNDNSVNSVKNRPCLLTAKTIIHEVIHAEMFRKLLSLSNSNGSIDLNKLDTMLVTGDYPGMLDYYFRYGGVINSNWQHEQMATHYREVIGRILEEYDTGNPVPDNVQPQQIYMDLAWEGLNHSTLNSWQQAISSTERSRIQGVIDNYINTNQGQPCN